MKEGVETVRRESQVRVDETLRARISMIVQIQALLGIAAYSPTG